MPDQNDQDQLLQHSYDGIQEFDNPMPRWWVYLFWATIVFSVLYWLNVPGFGIGKGQIADYERDMAAAAAAAAKQRAAEPAGASPEPPGDAGTAWFIVVYSGMTRVACGPRA